MNKEKNMIDTLPEYFSILALLGSNGDTEEVA